MTQSPIVTANIKTSAVKEIRVRRYSPDAGENPDQEVVQNPQPYWQSFTVPCDDSTSVLDALLYIQQQQDSSLSFRWSCRMAICGSCGFMVDGIPALGCKTFLRDYGDSVAIEPLTHFAIEKDLVVDMEVFLKHLHAVKPYLIRAENDEAPVAEPQPMRQTPAQMARYQAFADCINCGLCYAACPQFGLNPEFIGPAALTLAHRYNLDSRDQGKQQRIPVLNQDNGVWGCTFVGFCSDVCPQKLDPAAAVNQGKIASTIDFVTHKFQRER